MQNGIKVWLTVSATALIFAGCGGPEKELNISSLDSAITNHIAKSGVRSRVEFFDVKSIELLEIVKSGSKLNPLYEGVYKAKVELNEDIFQAGIEQKTNEHIYTTNFKSVIKSFPKGHASTITGRFTASAAGIDAKGKPELGYHVTQMDVVSDRWQGLPISSYGVLWTGQDDLNNKKPYIVVDQSPEASKSTALVNSQIDIFRKRKADVLQMLPGKWVTEIPFMSGGKNHHPKNYRTGENIDLSEKCQSALNNGTALWLNIDAEYNGDTCLPGSFCKSASVGKVKGGFYTLGNSLPEKSSGRMFLDVDPLFNSVSLQWDNPRYNCSSLLPPARGYVAKIDPNTKSLRFTRMKDKSLGRRQHDEYITITLRKSE